MEANQEVEQVPPVEFWKYFSEAEISLALERLTASDAVLAYCAELDSAGVRRAVAASPRCSPELLTEMAEREQNERVRRAIEANPACPVAVRVQLLADGDIDRLRVVAGVVATPPEILAALCTNHFVAVRRTVAANPACPQEALVGLIDDRERPVIEAVLQNPACPAEAIKLVLMRRDTTSAMRQLALKHPACTPEILHDIRVSALPRSARLWVMGRALVPQLGEDRAAWEAVTTLLDADFDGTLGELARQARTVSM